MPFRMGPASSRATTLGPFSRRISHWRGRPLVGVGTPASVKKPSSTRRRDPSYQAGVPVRHMAGSRVPADEPDGVVLASGTMQTGRLTGLSGEVACQIPSDRVDYAEGTMIAGVNPWRPSERNTRDCDRASRGNEGFGGKAGLRHRTGGPGVRVRPGRRR